MTQEKELIILEEHLINFRRGTTTFEDIEAYARNRPHTTAPDGSECVAAVNIKYCRHVLEAEGRGERTATLAAYEDLWKFCLINGAEQHGDIIGLPKDPLFPLKLIKRIAEKRYESLRTTAQEETK